MGLIFNLKGLEIKAPVRILWGTDRLLYERLMDFLENKYEIRNYDE